MKYIVSNHDHDIMMVMKDSRYLHRMSHKSGTICSSILRGRMITVCSEFSPQIIHLQLLHWQLSWCFWAVLNFGNTGDKSKQRCCLWVTIYDTLSTAHCCAEMRKLTAELLCHLCAVSFTILFSYTFIGHYMFRPNWSSSGVQVVMVKDSTVHCTP
jgi:hypothetical protein